VGENVRGLTNWNGGLVFDEVCADLEAIGYQVAPFIIPASAVNAPHKRERIWIVAYREIDRRTFTERADERKKYQPNNGHAIRTTLDTNGSSGFATNTMRTRYDNCKETRNIRDSKKKTQGQWCEFATTVKTISSECKSNWRNFPTQPPIRGGDDGLPTELDGITFPKWRNESIKAYGNAVVPQVVYEIFKAIEAHEAIR
jgi:DNA (cytosine-5)-methyltransferase 1